MNRILLLLEQIIDVQKQIDEIDNHRYLKEHKGCQSLGSSWMNTHLNNLKELVLEEDHRLESIIQPNYNYQICHVTGYNEIASGIK